MVVVAVVVAIAVLGCLLLFLPLPFTAVMICVVDVEDFSRPPPLLALTPNFLDVIGAFDCFFLAVLDFFFPMVGVFIIKVVRVCVCVCV